MMVAQVFVRVEMRTSLGKAVNVHCQGGARCVYHNPDPRLTALSTNGANDSWLFPFGIGLELMPDVQNHWVTQP